MKTFESQFSVKAQVALRKAGIGSFYQVRKMTAAELKKKVNGKVYVEIITILGEKQLRKG